MAWMQIRIIASEPGEGVERERKEKIYMVEKDFILFLFISYHSYSLFSLRLVIFFLLFFFVRIAKNVLFTWQRCLEAYFCREVRNLIFVGELMLNVRGLATHVPHHMYRGGIQRQVEFRKSSCHYLKF